MTLAQLAITVAVLGLLGLVAGRLGISAIPAYLLAGWLLGPNEPREFSLIQPSEVTDFVAELGLVFLLFFLGLEFTLERFARSGRHFGLGGSIDLAVNLGIGLLVGVAAFGFSFAALIVAALLQCFEPRPERVDRLSCPQGRVSLPRGFPFEGHGSPLPLSRFGPRGGRRVPPPAGFNLAGPCRLRRSVSRILAGLQRPDESQPRRG